MMSKEELMQQASKLDYKPEIYEKVHNLLLVLEQLVSVPYLKDRLVLKGGTALNLFHFEPIPRLSVDIDLNYIGHIDREIMLQEKPFINEAMIQILHQNQFERDRIPNRHAGAKTIWRYVSALGQMGNLEIDLNYMYRKPLWPIIELEPKMLSGSAFKVPVLDIHELAAGKFSALFSRKVSRDFFDAHFLLTNCKLDRKKLRESFIIYAGFSDTPLDNLSVDSIDYDIFDIRNKLFPVLKQKNISRKKLDIEKWANQIRNELNEKMLSLLPLQQTEIEFIRMLREQGEVRPELITEDKNLIEAVLDHPLIKWKALQSTNQDQV